MLRGFNKILIEAKRGSQTVLRSTTKQELKGGQQLPAKHFSQFSAVLKGWGGVIWVRMNYLNTPLIRLQVLIDAPTLFLTLLKEIFGILAGLIIFNVFEYLKLQLLTVIETFIGYSIRLLCVVGRVRPLKNIFFPNLMMFCNAFISTATVARSAYRCWAKTFGDGTSRTDFTLTAARRT